MANSHVLIISPASAKANNGNGQTAARWSRFLQTHYHVACRTWEEHLAAPVQPEVVIALHARRSAEAMAEFARTRPEIPRILVLTGTDVYRDIHVDASAQRSLALATRLVVLQPAALDQLSTSVRARTAVIFQSARSLKPVTRELSDRRPLRVIMVGHLRAEKDPMTFLRAAALLRDAPIRFLHIGAALDAELGAAAAAGPCAYQWLGDQPHAATRQHLKHSDLMVITSRMEGGANVVIEAVTSGVPVLASDISGNRGMLGEDYGGYFPVGDEAALAALIRRLASDPVFDGRLRRQCQLRAALFAPERERAAVRDLVDNCLRLHDPTTTSSSSKDIA